MKKVIIVGGGVGGLASAIRLKAQGYAVELFEKEARVGGKLNQFSEKGFTFDMGPTIVMLPEHYRAVFESAGKKMDDYVRMQRLNPVFSYFFSDQTRIDLSTDLVDLTQFLETLSIKDTQGFFLYLAEIYRRYQHADAHFLTKAYRKPSEFFNPSSLLNALKLKTLDTAYHTVSKFVKDDRLRKLLSFPTLYIGISPYVGPSIYSIITLVELLYGVWFFEGGMYGYVQGLVKLIDEMKIPVHTQQHVDEIVVDHQRAIGVRVQGTFHPADIVLCNADFPYAMDQLIFDDAHRKPYTRAKLQSMEYACSTFMLYLGVNKKMDHLDVHNIFFADDFDRNISDIFKGTLPQDMSVYFYCPAKLDPSLAPEGKEALYVLVPIPNLKTLPAQWDEVETRVYRNQIMERIKQLNGMSDLEAHIEVERVFTPRQWQSVFNAHYGATFGLAPTLNQSTYFRPQPKSKSIENLYFAGSSIHPGAGVPIVLKSVELALNEIVKDHG